MISVVIDTNTFLEILSVGDILRPYDQLDRGEASELDTEEVDRRIGRVQESLILGQVLHKKGMTSYTLSGETLRILTKMVPPFPSLGESNNSYVSRHYTGRMVHFVKDEVWDKWLWVSDTVPEIVTSNECDQLLVNRAKQFEVSLISRESPTKKGSIYRRAELAGVEVLSPEQFIRRAGVDVGAECFRFLQKFRRKASKYLATVPLSYRQANLDQLNEMLHLFDRMLSPAIYG